MLTGGGGLVYDMCAEVEGELRVGLKWGNMYAWRGDMTLVKKGFCDLEGALILIRRIDTRENNYGLNGALLLIRRIDVRERYYEYSLDAAWLGARGSSERTTLNQTIGTRVESSLKIAATLRTMFVCIVETSLGKKYSI